MARPAKTEMGARADPRRSSRALAHAHAARRQGQARRSSSGQHDAERGFAVTAGRLAAYLAASGFAPAIGFLHADKRGRWSLAWDAIEPLRPAIEARVFRLIERERFDLSDFVRAPDGLLRLAPGLLAAVLNQCAPPHAALAQCVKWIERLILSAGQHGSGEADQPLRDARAFRLERRNAGLERATLGRLPIGSHGERV